ncbi:HrpT family type III secretion system protein [Pseudomonas sp. D1HM]|uniref:HrpT family type III secretion system protein n=1 Tax=Pseudomonas sp. D1HM TaxID=1784816 RepID=UPI001040BF7B|nr:HrpT family type III secretion system protein [Pseudomonas sp. D1HM]MBW0235540.1 type III secretion protein [Pseudomonas sp. D1HM]
MIRLTSAVMTAGLVVLLQGCTTLHCRGDSCARPQSSAEALVIWWPPHMRIETDTHDSPPDHQVLSLQR